MRIPIHRDADHELVGFVIPVAHAWRAVTIFGGILDTCDTQHDARAVVLARGLKSLATHWQYYDVSADAWHTCLIQEASTTSVTIVLGYASVSGAPTKQLTAADFARGDILTLE
ncbi:MAG: hypothetical protein RLY87_1446 [Chloroflexota bacterium]|jgi:hypothetical protein